MGKPAEKLFHFICVKDEQQSKSDTEDYFLQGFKGSAIFFERFDGHVDIRGKDILDFGCGYGSTCFYMAQQGAKSVTGIDIDEHRVRFAEAKLASAYNIFSSIVKFYLPYVFPEGRQFDIVISKDCFEHYTNPEETICHMKQYLKQDGVLVIGFSPLWKAPYGGHISFMTPLPWAHLLFPEEVIMAERRRFRPDEDAKSFEQIRGGLNKMTLAKYLQIMKDSNLELEYCRINVSTNKLMKVFNVLRRMPFCQDFFTQSIYSVMRPQHM